MKKSFIAFLFGFFVLLGGVNFASAQEATLRVIERTDTTFRLEIARPTPPPGQTCTYTWMTGNIEWYSPCHINKKTFTMAGMYRVKVQYVSGGSAGVPVVVHNTIYTNYVYGAPLSNNLSATSSNQTAPIAIKK